MLEIISKPSCPFCTKAKRLLESTNIEHRIITVGVDISREDVLSKYPEIRSVPAVIFNGEFIGGYDSLVEWVNQNGPQLLNEGTNG